MDFKEKEMNLELKEQDSEHNKKKKEEFIEFMVDSEVLKFGEFTLKSGRKSPFFMNTGISSMFLVWWELPRDTSVTKREDN